MDPTYRKTTRDIRVDVAPVYLGERECACRNRFLWAYHVKIANEGPETVRLVDRRWRIVDAVGRVLEVSGSGVIGEQPVLAPGEEFAYTSGTPLDTPSGMMFGVYGMETGDGRRFEIDVPPFSLDRPTRPARPH